METEEEVQAVVHVLQRFLWNTRRYYRIKQLGQLLRRAPPVNSDSDSRVLSSPSIYVSLLQQITVFTVSAVECSTCLQHTRSTMKHACIELPYRGTVPKRVPVRILLIHHTANTRLDYDPKGDLNTTL